MDKVKLSTANIVILAGGVVAFIASFLAFYSIKGVSGVDFSTGTVHTSSQSHSAWSSGLLLIATVPALLGAIAAAQVAVAAFASGVKLPEKVLGFTWNQIHLVLGFQATIMMLAWLIVDFGGADKGIGLYLMLLGSIALLVGAVLRMQEKPAGATPPPPAAS